MTGDNRAAVSGTFTFRIHARSTARTPTACPVFQQGSAVQPCSALQPAPRKGIAHSARRPQTSRLFSMLPCAKASWGRPGNPAQFRDEPTPTRQFHVTGKVGYRCTEKAGEGVSVSGSLGSVE